MSDSQRRRATDGCGENFHTCSMSGKGKHSSHSCQGHHDHATHADLNTADGRRRVAGAGIITAVFMVVEAVGGIISGSLALLADAAHMLTDSASLALAWLGYWFAAKAPDETRSFGFGRMRVLAAFVNGVALFALAAWITVESILRLLDPQPVAGSTMLWVAIGGLMINLIAAFVLHGGDNNDINLSGALLHVLGDLLGSVAAIAAAVVIMATSWTPIDPLLSILVALLLLTAGVRITQRAGHILLEGAPPELTPTFVRSKLINAFEGIDDVLAVHIWQLTEDNRAATVCIKAKAGYCVETLRQSVKHYLQASMHIQLSTVEIMSEAQAMTVANAGDSSDSANDAHSGELHSKATPQNGVM